MLCVVDDLQWLDEASAQVLAFVARRLLAERVALVFAVREPSAGARPGLPELRLAGLGHDDARALLATVDPRAASTSACASGSSPRRTATRSRCSSCPAG